MFLPIDFVKIIDGHIHDKVIQPCTELPFLPAFFFLSELSVIIVEVGKNCLDVACWLLIELTSCFYVSFLMVLLMRLNGFNLIEQNIEFIFDMFSSTKESLGNIIDTNRRNVSFNSFISLTVLCNFQL